MALISIWHTSNKLIVSRGFWIFYFPSLSRDCTVPSTLVFFPAWALYSVRTCWYQIASLPENEKFSCYQFHLWFRLAVSKKVYFGQHLTALLLLVWGRCSSWLGGCSMCSGGILSWSSTCRICACQGRSLTGGDRNLGWIKVRNLLTMVWLRQDWL